MLIVIRLGDYPRSLVQMHGGIQWRTQQVRAAESNVTKKIPAIALTAYARTEDRMRSLLAGYQAHLSKPVEPTELAAMVAALAGRTGQV